MKVAVYKDKYGAYRSYEVGIQPQIQFDYEFIGYEERNIEKPKKTVKKEVPCKNDYDYIGGNLWVREIVPFNAKNVKITYEIEE